MKEIKAYIKPHKLAEVALALHQIPGLSGVSVVDGRGFGHEHTKAPQHRDADDVVDFTPHVRIEVFCRDELAESVLAAIRQSAHTGLPGDGKIFVTAIETAVRVQTGERGEAIV